MNVRTLTFLLALSTCFVAAEGRADPPTPGSPELVEPLSVRALVADGKHNAFTAMVRWKDRYWLAFRKGTAHNSGDGDLVLLRSDDGKEWTEARRVNAAPDDRDPQMLATQSRLFLYDPAMDGAKLTSFVTYTDDGETWTDPQPVYLPQYIFWKPLAKGDRFYATAHLKSRDGTARHVHLITSGDALRWDKVSTIRGGNWESETTLWFAAPDRLVAFMRQKYGSPKATILESSAPFSEWSERRAGPKIFGGHAVCTFQRVTYLLSRSLEGQQTGTMIYTYEQGELHPYCALPSGGDCSYPAAVQDGGAMLVSYYSSHEGSTNVYLARVPLRGKR